MRLINLMYDLVTCLTTTPLRLLSLLGSVIAIGGFSLSVLLIVLRLALGPQWAAEGVFMLFCRPVYLHRRAIHRYGTAGRIHRSHL